MQFMHSVQIPIQWTVAEYDIHRIVQYYSTVTSQRKSVIVIMVRPGTGGQVEDPQSTLNVLARDTPMNVQTILE